MLSFLNLAPETRMTVYDFLLQSSLVSNKRISYISNNALHQREPLGARRYKLPSTIHENHLTFKGNKAIKKEKVTGAECNIHLADIDDLLSLAGTCRLIRSEILALAWSNADLSITSPALLPDLHYIFLHRLSSNTSIFIRSLQIKIEPQAWSSKEMRTIVGLVHTRLPQLEELVLNVPIRGVTRVGTGEDYITRRDAFMALRGLPRKATVTFHYWTVPGLSEQFHLWNGGPGPDPEHSRNMGRYFKNLRYGLDMKRKRRSGEQMKREQVDQVADVLEATVVLRSLGMV